MMNNAKAALVALLATTLFSATSSFAHDDA